MVNPKSTNFVIRVTSFAKMDDGSLEKIEKFSKEASRFLKDGERVLKLRDFQSFNGSAHVSELLFEVSYYLYHATRVFSADLNITD
jgi:hypothetical protein